MCENGRRKLLIFDVAPVGYCGKCWTETGGDDFWCSLFFLASVGFLAFADLLASLVFLASVGFLASADLLASLVFLASVGFLAPVGFWLLFFC